MSQNSISELWYTRCPVPTTSGIAQHFRWLHREFESKGIALKSIRAADDQAVRNSHFDHTHPGMFREGGNVPPIWARANGRDTAVVGITWVDEEQLILVRDDSDIRDLAGLKGRRLGLPLHATPIVDVGRAQDLRGLLTALELGGLTREQVDLVDIPADGFDLREQDANAPRRTHVTAAALLDRAVDAIYAKGAVSATLIAEGGLRPIFDINVNPDPLVRVNAGTPRPITVDRTLALEYPDVVARYLAVLLRTAQWALEHPDEVVGAIAAETGSTVDAVRRGFGPHLHRQFTPSLSDIYVEGLRQQKAFLLREGFLVADFDYEQWFLREPLELAQELAKDIEFSRAA
ncbi:ABC transporter substrate-binding protein [Caballeronia sp. dw_276]|uniref:ABC transporter substrate-binding protein n=1 Tax=Caballeronia sp. dw_276 TaxID=2719795 RepID=UPI001BD27FDF|nr:ABC transporter substrate-binding protein [Caballeronia sp. dw_276]